MGFRHNITALADGFNGTVGTLIICGCRQNDNIRIAEFPKQSVQRPGNRLRGGRPIRNIADHAQRIFLKLRQNPVQAVFVHAMPKPEQAYPITMSRCLGEFRRIGNHDSLPVKFAQPLG